MNEARKEYFAKKKRPRFPAKKTKKRWMGQGAVSFFDEGKKFAADNYGHMSIEQLRGVYRLTEEEVKGYPSVYMKGVLAGVTELGKKKKAEGPAHSSSE
jgi:hypothetical protein